MDFIPVTKQNISVSDEGIGLPKSYFGALSADFSAKIIERLKGANGVYSLFSLEYLFDDDSADAPYPAPVFNIDVKLETERIREIVEKYGKSEKETEKIVERILEARITRDAAKSPVKPLQKNIAAPQINSDSPVLSESTSVQKNIFNSSIQSVFNRDSKYNYYFSGTDNRTYRFFAPTVLSGKAANPLAVDAGKSGNAYTPATHDTLSSVRAAKFRSNSNISISSAKGMSFADSLKYAQENGLTFGTAPQEAPASSEEISVYLTDAKQSPSAITREEYFSPSLEYTDESGEGSARDESVPAMPIKDASAIADSVISAIRENPQVPLQSQPTLKNPTQPSYEAPTATSAAPSAMNGGVEMIYAESSSQASGNAPSAAEKNAEASIINTVTEKTFWQKLADRILPSHASQSAGSRTVQNGSEHTSPSSHAPSAQSVRAASAEKTADGTDESSVSSARTMRRRDRRKPAQEASAQRISDSASDSKATANSATSASSATSANSANSASSAISANSANSESSTDMPQAGKDSLSQSEAAVTAEKQTASSNTTEVSTSASENDITAADGDREFSVAASRAADSVGAPVIAELIYAEESGENASASAQLPTPQRSDIPSPSVAVSPQHANAPQLVLNEGSDAVAAAEQPTASKHQHSATPEGSAPSSEKAASSASAPEGSVIRRDITVTHNHHSDMQQSAQPLTQQPTATQQAVELVYSEAEAKNIIVNSEKSESGSSPVNITSAAGENITEKSNHSPQGKSAPSATADTTQANSKQPSASIVPSSATAVTQPIETAHIDDDIRTAAPMSSAVAAVEGERTSTIYESSVSPAELIYVEGDSQSQENIPAAKSETQKKSEVQGQKTTSAEKATPSAAQAAQTNSGMLSRLAQPIKTSHLDGDIRSSAAKSISAKSTASQTSPTQNLHPSYGLASQTSPAQDYSTDRPTLTDAPSPDLSVQAASDEMLRNPQASRSPVSKTPSVQHPYAEDSSSSAVTDAKLLEVAKVLGNLNSSNGAATVLKEAGLIKNGETVAASAAQMQYSQSHAETFFPEQASEQDTAPAAKAPTPFTTNLTDKVLAAANELIKNNNINSIHQKNSSPHNTASRQPYSDLASELEHMQELTYAEAASPAQNAAFSAQHRSATEFSPINQRFNPGQNISAVEPMYPTAETFLNIPQAQQASPSSVQAPPQPFTSPLQAHETPSQRRSAPRQANASHGAVSDNIVWSAPTMPAPPIIHKEKSPAEAEQPTRKPPQVTDAEIKRMADKVYKIIEERLKTERRRMGL